MDKILVALSGGVDSSVAALLLKKQGYRVSGAYIRTWMNEEMPLGDCPAQQDIKDARAVAKHLGIDFEVVNLVNEYRDHVVHYLVEGYKNGITPNPDIMCNREMKFGIFKEYARKQGFDALATGHYVRRQQSSEGRFNLLQGIDPNKDQSYFLALLRQEHIQQVLFPLGNHRKSTIRELAIRHKLPNAEKKDSQGICFLGDVPINRFLEHYIEDKPGNIINCKGKVLGRHKGLHRYTLGQRRWIGVPSNTDNEFYVVIGFNHEHNELIVGFDNPESPGLFGSEFFIDGLSFIDQTIHNPCQILAKPRYRDPSQSIHYYPTGTNTARVVFDQPQRALASGQVIAFYRGETLLGGGFYQ